MHWFIAWFLAEKPRSFELKIAMWLFAILVVITVISLIFISETDVKECKKDCTEKGFENSIYVPSQKGKEAECKCYNKVKTENGIILNGEK